MTKVKGSGAQQLQARVDKCGEACENSETVEEILKRGPFHSDMNRSLRRGKEMRKILLKVNGVPYSVDVTPYETLARVLREKLGFTDVKLSCEKGECGSCTVLDNGKPVVSCLLLAVKADGREIITARGLAQEGKLHVLQEKFIEQDAIQCGYCTPGMLISAKALLDANPNPSEEDIRRALSGNICRCTGYQQIVEAIAAAARHK
jgi:carbon-monoxide dehydrogenase small subunit